MLNKLKIAALVAVTLVSMVVYKKQFDVRAADKRRNVDENNRW